MNLLLKNNVLNKNNYLNLKDKLLELKNQIDTNI